MKRQRPSNSKHMASKSEGHQDKKSPGVMDKTTLNRQNRFFKQLAKEEAAPLTPEEIQRNMISLCGIISMGGGGI